MNIDRSGIILYVENYDECVSFYSNILELRIEFQKQGLTSFIFGGAYLMIESGGVALEKKKLSQNPCILRINVTDVQKAAATLRLKGIEVTYSEYEWGEVALFTDPDGNYCEFKDSEKFNTQVAEGQ